MLYEGKQALLNTVATALHHIMTSLSSSQVMSCHFLYDFKNCFNLLPHEGELKAGLGGLLCSIGLNFCSDIGMSLDLPISSSIIDL